MAAHKNSKIRTLAARIKRLLNGSNEDAVRPASPLNTPTDTQQVPDDNTHEQPSAPRSNHTPLQSELFAELLLELPAQRRHITTAYDAGDMRALGHAVHHLLGAVRYCDAADLDSALNNLRLAIGSGEQTVIEQRYTQTLSVLDNLLALSGVYRADTDRQPP